MPRRVLILGATSAIAQETARLLARERDRLFLVARDAEKLRIVVEDVTVRGAEAVGSLVADLDELDHHEEIVARADSTLEGLDTVLVAHGVLGSQRDAERDYAEVERVMRTNLLSAISLLTLLANRFEAQGSGTIVVISSVAGDRGRQSNYVYGASKGALSLFLGGLRGRLQARGVRVITVKPGFVDTPMTAHIDKSLLFSKPAQIARGIHRAMRRGKDTVYLPGFWRVIMGVITRIPEPIFKRMGL